MSGCKCDTIDWEKYYINIDLYNPDKCECCYCKKRRKEIDDNTYKKCKDYIKYYSKGRKHIFPPCTWY